MKKKLLKNNIFSYYLGYRSGAVTFGGVDTKYIMTGNSDNALGSFTYAKVTDKGYWSIEILDVELQYGDAAPSSTGICKSNRNNRCKAIVDTGTYLIYGPKKDVQGTLGSIMVNSCEDLSKLPAVIFVLYAGDNEPPARLRLRPPRLHFGISYPSRLIASCWLQSTQGRLQIRLCGRNCTRRRRAWLDARAGFFKIILYSFWQR